ncbi:MAG: ATP-binding protein [Phycisphaerales bacterium]
MTGVGWLFIGIGVGVGATVIAARWQIRRSLARQLAAERRARSAERLAEVGAMTGGLAHEIKNPLSTIGLNAQLLAEGIEELPESGPTSPESKQRLIRRLASLRRETERLRGILSDFLAYAGEMRLDRKDTDISALLQDLADFFQPQAASQGVNLRVDLATGPLTASVDAGLLKQAVLNLMLNAVQAMSANPAGKPKDLIVRTRVTPGDKAGTDSIELHVIDTGPGIPAEVIPRIFQPYFTTKAGGSGLGLPTTRRIIEAHGGRIDVHTSEGNGTDFTVTIAAAGARI